MKMRYEEVKNLFQYQDGKLFWRVKPSYSVNKGDEAGYVRNSGYRVVQVKGQKYFIHQLIFLYHHGYMPKHEIDHINRNKLDNHIINLRDVSVTCNRRNVGNRKDNTSGVRGVCWNSQRRKWEVKIKNKGKTKHFGRFSNFNDAVIARLKAECELKWGNYGLNNPAYRYLNK